MINFQFISEYLISAATRSFVPYISKVPDELKEEFMEDIVQLALSYNSKDLPEGVSVEMPFKCLLAYARKGR